MLYVQYSCYKTDEVSRSCSHSQDKFLLGELVGWLADRVQRVRCSFVVLASVLE